MSAFASTSFVPFVPPPLPSVVRSEFQFVNDENGNVIPRINTTTGHEYLPDGSHVPERMPQIEYPDAVSQTQNLFFFTQPDNDIGIKNIGQKFVA